ncbi:inositol-3-phosphate synthase [Actinocorallia sp. A-T 12471]|uniref:inositol-3-phosphate synthase n=1 Tax=Actinocorallia sp. A-T 12471 TaxID=3089813 RepID=UPI0029D17D86|nr:inositol-3-phosphate synthase [Actinocorallia sp. A-T 12471]MDX6740603.1 inositol-3-phosphate synthase [Actinocorallia sp. A-T 12471]
MKDDDRRVGVWFVGARGSVATTAVVGALAIRAGLAEPVGLVTETPDFSDLDLPSLDQLVFGGHDIAQTPLAKRAEELADAGVMPRDVVTAIRDELVGVEGRLRVGAAPGDRRPQGEAAAELASDIAHFTEENRLDRVVVVNVSSTEPPVAARPAHDSLPALELALKTEADVLPTSSLYAYAALRAGASFVDFTPSTGMRLPALAELADANALPYAGRDGKTGQTLLRTALAPMFTSRALRVLSWSGANLLGGGDGATLADPEAAASKTASKQRGLSAMLGQEVAGATHIDYVADMGEWKTAWDHVRFEGFLGTRMTMQVTWQGCDSTLAAPLVLDLVRLTACAHEAGARGDLASLGFFFKDPLGGEHRLAEQYARLKDWAGGL